MNPKVLKKKKILRLKRKLRIRDCFSGDAIRPRVSVFRSNKYFYAQAIDDKNGCTIAAISSKSHNLGNNREDAKKLGEEFAKLLLSNQIKEIVFDRNGYLYHGVVACFADNLRSNGIVF
ncbi:50S ribosomal protein L18 [Helicobacter muridarum]|uniref:Large ribosomal subunit protein uL18 n=1 Tax=Helicobacter muridarum TaxID=216 RepID=A0A099TVA6_9HELI|nr:50S ribosomal protein L18 [Helicobacter muridarum]TLE01433.1 50S ribosomal protein L18 [Helicobacter muridarum]STQ85362.1 50S ribosomal protein L18 [Helicobacter muridarum]